MTNQEAMRLIRNLPTMCEFTDAYGEQIDSDAYYEAVDMAIAALEAQEIRDLLPVSPLLDKKKKKRKREAISALQAQPEPCNLPQLDATYKDGDKLDEAIHDFERNAQNDDDNFHLTGAKCFNGCAEYEWRIVSWLRELKERREQEGE